MPTPNLIHPIPVELEQIDRTSTVYDEDAREPVQVIARDTKKTLKAQVLWGGHEEASSRKGGLQEGDRGYLLFRQKDLTAQGVDLAVGDRFAKIGLIKTDVYISRLEPLGHYPSAGGHTLMKAYFADRAPSRQTKG